MKQVDYLILGAGPAGLTFANQLLRHMPNADFLVLEAEKEAGGLCRSVEVDGSPFDIGGGHFLDVRRPKVNEFLFSFMPVEEWDLYDRDSRINMGEYEIGHPFEANIWQMPVDSQVAYLKSIALAGCNLGTPMPEHFVDWITWKLGDLVAREYMLPYNGKMFGGDLDSLGTYWLSKLPNVSFEDTLYSCLNRKPYGTQPGHAQFYYPKKYGYGELWRRMGESLGNHILYQKKIVSLNPTERLVSCADGSMYQAKVLITTIPWNSIEEFDNVPQELVSQIRRLKSTGTQMKYVPENLDTKAQWIYIPDEKISYHRILVRHNFCPGSKGYWLETNLERVEKEDDSIHFEHEYTYPLNTIEKPEIMRKLLDFMSREKVYGLGRWGEHEHYNSDVTVERAMQLFEEVVK